LAGRWHDETVRAEVLTDRLRLRAWSTADVERAAVLFAQPEVWWFPLRRGFSFEETHRFVGSRIDEFDRQGWTLWAAELRDTGTLIGYIGLAAPTFLPEIMPTVEVGWRLDPDYWGKGLASEGAEAALEFGFVDLGLDHIVSITEPDNWRSERVMKRLGMTHHLDTSHPEMGMPLRVYRLALETWRDRSQPTSIQPT
jgi:RimJ/RimL family protein N-acetyltransferase